MYLIKRMLLPALRQVSRSSVYFPASSVPPPPRRSSRCLPPPSVVLLRVFRQNQPPPRPVVAAFSAPSGRPQRAKSGGRKGATTAAAGDAVWRHHNGHQFSKVSFSGGCPLTYYCREGVIGGETARTIECPARLRTCLNLG